MQLTAIIKREHIGYVALCPQLDIASQGQSVAEARENLTEALELFFETAERSEVGRRLRTEVYVTQVEAGGPSLRLMPPQAASTTRQLGGLEGQIWMSDDFDEEDEELVAEIDLAVSSSRKCRL